MKTKILTLALLATLSMGAFAQKRPPQPLPSVQAPRELTEVGSEYVEGTITRLSDQDASQFLPWAQNAQSVLTKALRDIETMPVEQQTKHLTMIIKSVVKNSGQKNYQMFMRFALNRTLLLVKELVLQSEMQNPGLLENVLDLQIKGIEVALQFYESDLAFQRRAKQGNDTVNLEYARFGATFGKAILGSIQNVLDASAQYRLLYKVLEMINWDFSRDSIAIEFSDSIIEIYNTLNLLDENPSNDDRQSVNDVRRLSVLLGPVNTVERTALMNNAETRRQIEEQERIERETRERRELERQLATGIGVIFQGRFALLNGANNQTIYQDCMTKTYAGQIDTIVVAYGNRSSKIFTTSGWWNQQSACQTVVNHLSGLTSLRTNSFSVYGSLESNPFAFKGTSMASIMSQCQEFVGSNRLSQIDEMAVGVDNQEPKRIMTSSWWTTNTICGVLLDKVSEFYR